MAARVWWDAFNVFRATGTGSHICADFRESVCFFTENLVISGRRLLIFIPILMLSLAVVDAQTAGGNETGEVYFEKLGIFPAAGALLSILFVFAGLVCAGYRSNKSLNKGEMRRAIAGTYIFAFVVLIFVLLHIKYPRVSEVVAAFVAMVTTIVGFYFGSRTAQRASGEGESVGVENVEFSDDKLVLSLRNRGEGIAEVDAAYINNKRIDAPKLSIAPRSLLDMPLSFEWKPGEEYAIKLCTSAGICSEVRVKAPGGGKT